MKHILILLLLGSNSIQDVRRLEILLWPTVGMLVAGLAVAAAETFLSGQSMIAETGSVATAAALAGRLLLAWSIALLPGIFLFLAGVASRGGIGRGDAMIVCAIGLWAGAVAALISSLLAFALLPVVVCFLREKRKTNTEWPFVPFLLAGYLGWLLWGGVL